MRLKSLEIKGFKSFANQTLIHFNEDVIGIVGPNGSGKSNIVDAIRWVLGEQSSKELRLDQMLSVIFNGTKKRKAAGLAQVSLTFENTRNLLPTEYNTVTLSRLLYRTGESEYRLNNVPCRLKDITSLFLDTGIGSNSYAIIALGMVDDILEDKEDSRRRMFEQAAGVAKYKARKRETLSKLKSTSEDLDRVEDLLHEIGANLKTLEKQAKRARRYFEMREEYKKMSIELALIRVSALKESHKSLSTQIEQEQDRFRSLDAQSRQVEAALEQTRKTHLDKEKAVSEQQRELNQLVGYIRGVENDRKMMQQKQQFLEQAQARSRSELEASTAQLAQLTADIEHYRSELNLEKRIEARHEQELQQVETQLAQVRESHGTLKADLDKVLAEQQGLEKAVVELEKQRAILRNQIAALNHEIERREGERELRAQSMGQLKEKADTLRQQEDSQQSLIDSLEKAESERQAALQKAEGELEGLNREVARTRRELDAKRNEFKLTKSMVENLEGFPESIRFLNNQKAWKKNADLLSDLIYVSEGYRVAIENYLEPYLNYYVVLSLEEAYQAISLLGKSQQGKANFFILDAFAQYQPPMVLLPAGTQSAIDLVSTDPAYRNLCSYLLENVIVTEQDEAAGDLPESPFVVLSKSGGLVKSRYSVSGGSIGLFEGKRIGRKKNLEILEKDIAKAQKEEEQYAQRIAQLQERVRVLKAQRSDAQIQQHKQTLNKMAQERIALDTTLANYESLIAESLQHQQGLQTRVAELELQYTAAESDIQRQSGVLSTAREAISHTDTRFRELAEVLSKASASFNEKNIAFIRQQNKVAAVQRELAFREKQGAELKQSIDQNTKSLALQATELDALLDALQQHETNLQEHYAQRRVKEAALSEAEQIYYKARSEISGLEDQLRQLSRQSQDLQVLINKLKDAFNDVKFEISAIAQRIRIEFDLGINDILQQEPERSMDEAALQEEVDKVKKKLDTYGEINPMAVEAYDEMKGRFDTITTQRDDILHAKSALEQTIREIEETATNQFLASFENVRLYFIDVFRSLFTEDDNCDLILLDPQNPLESRIEIVAKPKGKRPQTISQLSGGEKTLTATALLFALYLLKPAPFCIFDEVDAPLDDANISKFNRIIKKFSKESQFIIVTHNKLTMAAVDTIYGVYMAEQGVSGVTPVNFKDYEHVGTFETAEREK